MGDRPAPAAAPAEPVLAGPAAGQGDPLEVSLRAAGLDVRAVPRLDNPTVEQVRQVVAARRGPMVFTGLTEQWKARSAWDPETLIRTRGEKVVTALVDLPPGGVLFPREQHYYEQSMTFSEFVARMLAATESAPCYLAYARADELFPDTDYDFATVLGTAVPGSDTRVWIGSAGTRSMLHSDLKDNFFCQIWGSKHVVLIPGEDSRAAYPFPDNLVNSRVDLANLDLDKFPRLRETVLYAGKIEPGEVLFMPRGCWHDVRSRTPSISINHWFGPALTFGDYSGLLLRLGPRHWLATARDFVRYGLLGKREKAMFFFTPSSTGKRLYDLLRRGDFSAKNDPSSEEK
ncbi:cupin-like domain-containing protein [Amycolatopsis sp. NBC_00345]|uniref:cupin-like domain-containing protein n=1 Tax=Amycolatopsis sp. NBC_00345 TaxID=2975955 RepID=UPI002E266BD9